MPVNSQESITVFELNQRLSDVVAQAPGVRGIWVVGETCDVRVSGGHCYLELVEKDANGGNRSRIRAIIWANVYRTIVHHFRETAASDFVSGIKVRVRVTASYHPSYGMSVNISEIDPAYTAGDALRRRAEIIKRLTDEGLIELNRRLRWATAPNRVAVISAHGAAGYGDFINQLLGNSGRYRFHVDFYPAIMQGENTARSVMSALSLIESKCENYDIVVIIRGGGATSDLSAFDSYDIARAIATHPLPVIVGIGHERDVTVLDYVANTRVNTPTAAAELLIDRITELMEALGRATDRIYRIVLQRVSDNRELLAHAEASIPGLTKGYIARQIGLIDKISLAIATTGISNVSVRKEQLRQSVERLEAALKRSIERAAEKLQTASGLLKVLSPDAVLARGFSLTLLPDGKVVKDSRDVPPDVFLTTRLAHGEIISKTIKNTKE